MASVFSSGVLVIVVADGPQSSQGDQFFVLANRQLATERAVIETVIKSNENGSIGGFPSILCPVCRLALSRGDKHLVWPGPPQAQPPPPAPSPTALLILLNDSFCIFSISVEGGCAVVAVVVLAVDRISYITELCLSSCVAAGSLLLLPSCGCAILEHEKKESSRRQGAAVAILFNGPLNIRLLMLHRSSACSPLLFISVIR